MELTKKQRENLAKAFFSAANLILAIVVLGQFVTKTGFETGKIISGVIAYTFCIISGVTLDKGEI